MYSNNQIISQRQTYRLFLFDFMGISTLILPSLLAGSTGIYGVGAILLGGVFGAAYLALLSVCNRRMNCDLIAVLSDNEQLSFFKKAVSLLLAATHTVSCGFVAAMIAGMVRQSLIKEESYTLLLILALALAGYAIYDGLECRARIYEVLYWFVILPLAGMLIVSAGDVELALLLPQTACSAPAVLQSAYGVFACFAAMFGMLFFPGKIKLAGWQKEGRTLAGCVGRAFLLALIFLLVSYVIMVGTFGEVALSKMRYPIITLMSTVQIKGGFVKRLDAIMLAVWFFTLFALTNFNMYYGGKLLGCVAKGRHKFLCQLPVILGAFAVAMAIGYREELWTDFLRFFLYVQTPLYIVLPIMLACLCGWRRTRSGCIS